MVKIRKWVISWSQQLGSYSYMVNCNLYCTMYSVSCLAVKNVCFVVSAPALPDSMLPLGMAAQDNSSKLVPIQPSKCLLCTTTCWDTVKLLIQAPGLCWKKCILDAPACIRDSASTGDPTCI